jgi:hypothetical protein
MIGLARRRRSLLRPLALGLGVLLVVLCLLVGGWLVWGFLRPPPDGFAPTTGQAASFIGQPPGILQYTIDARSRKDWAYFDFSGGTAVSTSQENLDWDLAFRRTRVLTNGGEINPAGQGGAVELGDIPLGQAAPPAEGYLADTTHEERGLENPALRRWYNYNWITHTVTSKNHTYAVRTAMGEVVLLTLVSYYCDDGSAGCITFRYAYPNGP